MDGLLRCSRYSFGPNRLHYCGPDANQEMLAYLDENASDPGLEKILAAFRTLYPYLTFIARVNGIADPFDERVVEAYWIGNYLLEDIKQKNFYNHLLEDHEIKKRIGAKSFEYVADKIRQGALPHHSFHVLDIWKRTGHLDIAHTPESMDACRISWGRVLEVDGAFVKIMIEPLLCGNGKLFLGREVEKKITRAFTADAITDEIKISDVVSMHWGAICEVMTPEQVWNLKKYTLRHIELANQTI